MKRSRYFIPTLKEKPSDIEQIDQVYMFRSGMLKKVSNGFFVYLPLMQRVLKKVTDVIRTEMEETDSVECKFPILVSQEALEASGRWNAFGKEMFKLVDRSDNGFAISPTNEETACFVADTYVKSYKDFPFSIYQIQSKHRDEISPRNGVMRAREFTMKDAYSFHGSAECLDSYYKKMKEAYLTTFKKLDLDVVAVAADTGAMGGSASEEIMAISSSGETDIVRCTACSYAANSETVPCVGIAPKAVKGSKKTTIAPAYKKVHTPRVKSIDELVKFFNKSAQDFCKAVVFEADGKLILALVRGDREVNDVKLKKLLDASELEIADPATIAKSKKTAVGFVGAVGLNGIKIYADYEVAKMTNFIVGANEKDYHLTDVNIVDFAAEYADIRYAVDGDACPACNKKTTFTKATELGHIFALGTRYTNKLNMKFTNESGVLSSDMQMGCYGIGVERTIAAIVEQHHDEKGIKWPVNVAPFTVHLVTVDMTNDAQKSISQDIYNQLNKVGIETLWDDTDARVGSKFADSDLIGFPYRIVVGRGIDRGVVEFVTRSNGEKDEIEISKVINVVQKLVEK